MHCLLLCVCGSRHVNDDWLERLYHSCQQCDNDKEKESVADVSLGSKANEKHFRNSVRLMRGLSQCVSDSIVALYSSYI